MSTSPHLAVGYDGSQQSLDALRWAADLASRRGEDLHVVTVIDPRETPRGTAWPASWWDDLETDARRLLDDFPEVAVTFARHGGKLVPTLLESTSDASMLVVGSRGHSALGELVLGSTSQSAARRATVPVVVVRSPSNPDPSRIVVGSDGSESAERAVEVSCQMAETTGSKLVVLRAWLPRTIMPEGREYTNDLPSDVQDALDRTVDQIRVAHPGVDVSGEIYQGSPEIALADASWDASVVVVGTRGRSGVSESLMGSVSNYVLHKSHCSVAVVP